MGKQSPGSQVAKSSSSSSASSSSNPSADSSMADGTFNWSMMQAEGQKLLQGWANVHRSAQKSDRESNIGEASPSEARTKTSGNVSTQMASSIRLSPTQQSLASPASTSQRRSFSRPNTPSAAGTSFANTTSGTDASYSTPEAADRSATGPTHQVASPIDQDDSIASDDMSYSTPGKMDQSANLSIRPAPSISIVETFSAPIPNASSPVKSAGRLATPASLQSRASSSPDSFQFNSPGANAASPSAQKAARKTAQAQRIFEVHPAPLPSSRFMSSPLATFEPVKPPPSPSKDEASAIRGQQLQRPSSSPAKHGEVSMSKGPKPLDSVLNRSFSATPSKTRSHSSPSSRGSGAHFASVPVSDTPAQPREPTSAVENGSPVSATVQDESIQSERRSVFSRSPIPGRDVSVHDFVDISNDQSNSSSSRSVRQGSPLPTAFNALATRTPSSGEGDAVARLTAVRRTLLEYTSLHNARNTDLAERMTMHHCDASHLRSLLTLELETKSALLEELANSRREAEEAQRECDRLQDESQREKAWQKERDEELQRLVEQLKQQIERRRAAGEASSEVVSAATNGPSQVEQLKAQLSKERHERALERQDLEARLLSSAGREQASSSATAPQVDQADALRTAREALEQDHEVELYALRRAHEEELEAMQDRLDEAQQSSEAGPAKNDRVRELEERLTELHEELQEARQKHKDEAHSVDADVSSTSFTSAKSHKTAMEVELREEVDHLRGELDDLEAKYSQLEADAREVETDLTSELERRTTALNEDLTRASEERDAAQQLLQEAQALVEELQRNNEHLQLAQNQEGQAEIEGLTSRVREADLRVQGLEEEVASLQGLLDEVDRQRKEDFAVQGKLRSTNDRLQREQEELLQTLADLEQDSTAAQTQITQMEAALSDARDDADASNKDVAASSQLQHKLQALESQLKSARDELATLSGLKVEAEQQSSSLSAQLSQTRSRVSALELEVGSRGMTIFKLERGMEKLEREMQNHAMALSAKQQELNMLKRRTKASLTNGQAGMVTSLEPELEEDKENSHVTEILEKGPQATRTRGRRTMDPGQQAAVTTAAAHKEAKQQQLTSATPSAARRAPRPVLASAPTAANQETSSTPCRSSSRASISSMGSSIATSSSKSKHSSYLVDLSKTSLSSVGPVVRSVDASRRRGSVASSDRSIRTDDDEPMSLNELSRLDSDRPEDSRSSRSVNWMSSRPTATTTRSSRPSHSVQSTGSNMDLTLEPKGSEDEEGDVTPTTHSVAPTRRQHDDDASSISSTSSISRKLTSRELQAPKGELSRGEQRRVVVRSRGERERNVEAAHAAMGGGRSRTTRRATQVGL